MPAKPHTIARRASARQSSAMNKGFTLWPLDCFTAFAMTKVGDLCHTKATTPEFYQPATENMVDGAPQRGYYQVTVLWDASVMGASRCGQYRFFNESPVSGCGRTNRFNEKVLRTGSEVLKGSSAWGFPVPVDEVAMRLTGRGAPWGRRRGRATEMQTKSRIPWMTRGSYWTV